MSMKNKIKVYEVMLKNGSFPTVLENDLMRDAIIKMDQFGLGIACLVNERNILVGVLTDGDLRRCLAEGEDIDLLDAEKIMTTDPVSISSNSSVDNALKLMEDRSSQISVLPVVSEENGECLGLIRLHDIYQTRLL